MDYSAETTGTDWDCVVARNRKLLAGIAEMLFALVVGLGERGMVETLPRCARNHVYRILRPAESALRRLIVIAARDIRLDAPAKDAAMPGQDPGARSAKPAAPKAPLYASVVAVDLGLAGVVCRPAPEAAKRIPVRPPVFALIDPLKRFHFGPRRVRSRAVSRIRSLGGSTLPVYMRRPEPPPIREPGSDDPVDAVRLCRRLIAFRNALDNLDREALRLARWKARRAAGRVRRFSPMRPGHPPGRRKRPTHEIDGILKDLHSLALHSESPDSS